MDEINRKADEGLSHLVTDYVQLSLYTVFLVVGLPVNVSTLAYMLKRYRREQCLLLLLHINLNISDILVLVFFCTGSIGWIATYEWRGGALLCKIMRYLDEFVFSISSNIMVCIAVYRLQALCYPVLVSTVGRHRIPRMILIAWSISALICLPQLFVWKQVQIKGVTQCTTIWTEKLHSNTSSPNDALSMKVYNAFHLVSIFYLPLTILTVCYVLILHDIYKTLNKNAEASSDVYLPLSTHGSICSKRASSHSRAVCFNKRAGNSVASVRTRAVRGEERLRMAKVRSLRITLLLIFCYVVTWLPYNLLSWCLILSTETYRSLEDAIYFLNCLVVLNSVINPFIYGRCTGFKMMFSCTDGAKKGKTYAQRCCGFRAM